MHEIKEPMQIDKNDCQSFKLEKPAIKLPVHTPVKGRGIATKPPNKNIFLIEVFFLFIFFCFASVKIQSAYHFII